MVRGGGVEGLELGAELGGRASLAAGSRPESELLRVERIESHRIELSMGDRLREEWRLPSREQVAESSAALLGVGGPELGIGTVEGVRLAGTVSGAGRWSGCTRYASEGIAASAAFARFRLSPWYRVVLLRVA